MKKLCPKICATILAATGLVSTTICIAFDYEKLYTQNAQHCSENLDSENQNILERFFSKKISESCAEYAWKTTLDEVDHLFLNKKLTDNEYRQVVRWLTDKATIGPVVRGIDAPNELSGAQPMMSIKSQEKNIEPLPTATGFKSIGAQSEGK